MKVKELIDALMFASPEAEVIVQKDSEGNSYSPLAGADPEAVYVPESTYHGSVYSLNWTADQAGMTEEEWKDLCAKPACVVLFPIN